MKNNLLSSFFEIAKLNPNSVASTDATGEITYGRLSENACRFYQSFTRLEFVNKKATLFYPGGIEAVSAIVSTLTAGLCYTVLDPATPSERNRTIYKTGNFDYLITNKELLSEAEKIVTIDRILIYDTLLEAEPVEFSTIPDVEPTNGAILFYTSGSTGAPKGVIHKHGRISIALRTSLLVPEDHLDMIIPLGFVASYNLIYSLSRGSTISFFDIKIMGVAGYLPFLKEKRITHSMMTVTVFRTIANIMAENEKFESLRSLMLVGEPVRPTDIELYRQHTVPGCILSQFYGTSETPAITRSVFSHEGEIPEKISAGKPLPSVSVYILDESLTILPSGQSGQIAVSSPLISDEYYNNPEATKKSYIVHPQTGLLTYLTGDIGYLSEDGSLFHQGRNDFMVKVRGSRVDILEIEDCLLKHPDIAAAIVVNKGDSFSETLLVAYCELKKEVKIPDLREYVSKKLPAYMIPSFFVIKDRLPQTSTGKTDRKELTEEPLDYTILLGHGADSQIEYDPLYQKLKTIWMEELKLPRVSHNHCFFEDLGGDSILAVSVLERIRKEIDIQLPYFILFRYRTLGKLTEYIHLGGNKLVSLELLRVPKEKQSPVIIFIPPIKGGAETYNFAPASFPADYGLYVLTYNIVTEDNQAFYPLDIILNKSAEIINTIDFSHLYLYGYSIGGLLAYEIAQRSEIGKVKKVFIIDIPPALKKKKNLFMFILNDFRLSFKNLLKGRFRLVLTNLWHILLCLRYYFIYDNKVRKFEFRNQLSLIEAAHLRFYMQFDHGKYNGDMLIIWSTEQRVFRKLLKWERIVSGNIEEKYVKSGHYDLLSGNKIYLTTEMVVESIKR